MRDTRRFRTLKARNYLIKHVQATTAGQEVHATGTGTGVIGQERNTDAYAGDKTMVAPRGSVGKTASEWEAIIGTDHPEYTVLLFCPCLTFPLPYLPPHLTVPYRTLPDLTVPCLT